MKKQYFTFALLASMLLALLVYSSEAFSNPAEIEHWRNLEVSMIGTYKQEDVQSGPGARLIESSLLIEMAAARDAYPYTGVDYSVAVLDTGIDYNHPALGNGWGNKVIAGWDFVNNNGDPMDDEGHGTHVAGIIAGDDETYKGIAPGANLIALKVLNSSGGGNFLHVEEAIDWIIDHREQYNIVVVNMSLGDNDNHSLNPYNFLENKFTTLLNEGVVIIASSGNSFYTFNSQQGLAYPAISPQVISVGAVWDANVGQVPWANGGMDWSTAADRVTSFSQRSGLLDIMAPGAWVTSTQRGGGFVPLGGTSMSAPIVAGAAVLAREMLDDTNQGGSVHQSTILSYFQDEGVTIVDGDDQDDNVDNTYLPFQRLNMLKVLEAIAETSLPDPTPTPTPTATATPSATSTPSATATPTATPTATSTPTITPTPQPSPTPTSTPVPTFSPTPAPTPTPTPTPKPPVNLHGVIAELAGLTALLRNNASLMQEQLRNEIRARGAILTVAMSDGLINPEHQAFVQDLIMATQTLDTDGQPLRVIRRSMNGALRRLSGVVYSDTPDDPAERIPNDIEDLYSQLSEARLLVRHIRRNVRAEEQVAYRLRMREFAFNLRHAIQTGDYNRNQKRNMRQLRRATMLVSNNRQLNLPERKRNFNQNANRLHRMLQRILLQG